MTTTLHSPWVTPELVLTSSTVPLCDFCIEGRDADAYYGRDLSDIDVASVRFDGKWACSFCAGFYWRDQPARLWMELDA